MQTKIELRIVLLILAVAPPLFVQTALGDSWALPDEASYASHNAEFKLTVFPRRLQGQREFFRDKADGIEPAGQAAGERATSIGRLEQRRPDGIYMTIWERVLANDVAPARAIVSASGEYVVTFDNWHSMGFGQNTVVIYGPGGALVRELALTDFLLAEEIKALPRTVSSIWWGFEHHFDEEEECVVLQVVEPGQALSEQNPQFRKIRLKLANGQVLQNILKSEDGAN